MNRRSLFVPGFVCGIFVALALHYFLPCDQSKSGHPRIQLSMRHD